MLDFLTIDGPTSQPVPFFGPGHGSRQYPSHFTVYFPRPPYLKKNLWPSGGHVEHIPQEILDSTPHADFVLVAPVDAGGTHYRAA
jgi:hypothetical protein